MKKIFVIVLESCENCKKCWIIRNESFDNRVKGGKMDKIIFIVLIIIIIILTIKAYENYVTIQIFLNKVSELERELFVLKNKEKIEKLKKAIKDSSRKIL